MTTKRRIKNKRWKTNVPEKEKSPAGLPESKRQETWGNRQVTETEL